MGKGQKRKPSTKPPRKRPGEPIAPSVRPGDKASNQEIGDTADKITRAPGKRL